MKRTLALIGAITVAAVIGCKQDTPTAVNPPPVAPNKKTITTPPPPNTGGIDGSHQTATTPAAKPAYKIFPVKLTDQQAAFCLVRAGDAMPEVELPDLQGVTTSLASLFGEKLTVVCFWSTNQFLGLQELGDLEYYIVEKFGNRGVQVVGIAVGETAETAAAEAAAAEVSYPILVDEDGSAFAKVGTEKLPRTYLLDASGNILWFDIEYSRSTRRELLSAIRATLKPE